MVTRASGASRTAGEICVVSLQVAIICPQTFKQFTVTLSHTRSILGLATAGSVEQTNIVTAEKKKLAGVAELPGGTKLQTTFFSCIAHSHLRDET